MPHIPALPKKIQAEFGSTFQLNISAIIPAFTHAANIKTGIRPNCPTAILKTYDPAALQNP